MSTVLVRPSVPHIRRVRRDRPISREAAFGLAIAVPPLTWWAIGPLGERLPDHEVGPYHFPLAVEGIVDAFAIAIAAASVCVIVAGLLGHFTPHHLLSVGATANIVGAGLLAAACWREMTAGVVGANIGGGMASLAGPLIIAGLLVIAVVCERNADQGAPRRRMRWLVLAAATAPLLYAIEIGVNYWDHSAGIINSRDYVGIHPGTPRHTVLDRLGRPGANSDWFFAPVASGLQCDYYSDGAVTGETVYRFCYRASILVSKNASDHPA